MSVFIPVASIVFLALFIFLAYKRIKLNRRKKNLMEKLVNEHEYLEETCEIQMELDINQNTDVNAPELSNNKDRLI